MAGFFQSDAVLKKSIELALADIRKNPWLIDYMMQDFVQNPYLKDTYGQKQIDACKEFFQQNNIDIYLGYRTDRMRLPCVSIILGNQPERSEMKFMGDLSTETIQLLPLQIGKPIPYVVKPFTPLGYNKATGEIAIDQTTLNINSIAVGMIAVNPVNGNGYSIETITPNGITIAPNLNIDTSQLGIVPQFMFYQARIEHIFQTANFTIVCTVHGDPQGVLWLHDVVLMGLLRYKESLLEALGLAETVMSSGELAINSDFTTSGGETAWDKTIQITGQIEQTFIKAPHRLIESIGIGEVFNGGIKIISNLDPPESEDVSQDIWTTIEDDNDES